MDDLVKRYGLGWKELERASKTQLFSKKYTHRFKVNDTVYLYKVLEKGKMHTRKTNERMAGSKEPVCLDNPDSAFEMEKRISNFVAEYKVRTLSRLFYFKLSLKVQCRKQWSYFKKVSEHCTSC